MKLCWCASQGKVCDLDHVLFAATHYTQVKISAWNFCYSYIFAPHNFFKRLATAIVRPEIVLIIISLASPPLFLSIMRSSIYNVWKFRRSTFHSYSQTYNIPLHVQANMLYQEWMRESTQWHNTTMHKVLQSVVYELHHKQMYLCKLYKV